MNHLASLYQRHYEEIYSVRESFPELNLEGPLLMHLEQYYQQSTKLMIIGQETKGWTSDSDIAFQQKTYQKFNMGEQYYSSPFWNITRKIEKILGIAPYSCAWSNLNRYDFDGCAPTDEILSELVKLDFLVCEEIKAVKPDVCLFFTNRKYDHRLRDTFEGIGLVEIPGLPAKHFSRLVHPELPYHTYRTPHPRVIRTRRWEEGFLSAISAELRISC